MLKSGANPTHGQGGLDPPPPNFFKKVDFFLLKNIFFPTPPQPTSPNIFFAYQPVNPNILSAQAQIYYQPKPKINL